MSLLDDTKRSAIIARINNLQADAPAQWGKMNCNQPLCHLADQFRGAMGEQEWKDQKNLFVRTVVRFLALYVIKVPKNVPTFPELDQEKEGTKPTDFENDRQILIGYIEKFVNAPEDFNWRPHAAFGKMNRKQWDRLSTKHLDHHLKQFGA